jgi:general secretion pathway protein L
MLNEIYSWWTRQMADLAAPVLRRLDGGEPDALLLTAQPDRSSDLSVARRRNGRLEALAAIPAETDAQKLTQLIAASRGAMPVILVLPAPPLIRDVELPIAALASLDRVVRYEMDRLTPFAVEDVFFAHHVVEADRTNGVVRLELVLVPKIWVRPLLDRLSRSSISPVALEAAGPDGAVRRIPILRVDPVRQTREKLAWRLAVTACCIMAACVVALPVVRQSLALQAVEDRIDELRPRVEQVQALRRRIAEGSAEAGRIAAARGQAGEPLTILGVLTDTLPDDTWLTSLTLRRRHLVLEGHSNAANRLISAMASEARLRNPSFAAPVVRAEDGGEVFTIQADVAP